MLTNLGDTLPYLALLFGGAGLYSFSSGSHEAKVIAIVLGLLGVWRIVALRLRGDEQLRAAAAAWPRFKDYRPARYAWETSGKKTPWGWPVRLAAALIAATLIYVTLSHGDAHDPRPWWPLVRSVALPLLVGIALWCGIRWQPTRELRKAMHAETDTVARARDARAAAVDRAA